MLKTIGKVVLMAYATVFAAVTVWALGEIAIGHGDAEVPGWIEWLFVPAAIFGIIVLGALVVAGWRWVFEKEASP